MSLIIGSVSSMDVIGPNIRYRARAAAPIITNMLLAKKVHSQWNETSYSIVSPLPRVSLVLPGKSRGTFDNVILSGGPYDPICTTTIYG